MKGCTAYNYFAPLVSLHEVEEDGGAQGSTKECFHYCKGLLVLQRLGNRLRSRISYRLVKQLDLVLANDPLPLFPPPSCLLTYASETLTDRMASEKVRD